MPNWKKLITSGSAGSLASLSVDTSVEATSFTGSLLSTNGVISGSAQLDGFVSQSGNFVANETIIATSTNSVTSSNILALDTVNNYLGINQSNPEVTLHMTGEDAQTAQIRMEQYNDSSDAPDIRTRKARGTSALPAKNNAGDFIYRQNSERYNGSAYTTVGQFAVDSTGSADRFRLTLTVSEDGNTIDAADAQFMIDGNNGGAIKFNDSYYFPTSDGSANEVLTTDGSGTLTFSNPIPSGTISSSAQIASNISGSITSTSSSIASDIATLVSFSSSLETTIYDYTGSFTGDGSGLTNVQTEVTEQATITDSFTSVTSKSVTHNFGTKNVIVSVYNNSDEVIIPASIITTDINTVDVTFDLSTSGRVVVAKGGHLVSGSAVFTGTSVVSGSGQIDALTRYEESITGASSYAITHNLDEQYPIVQVYNSSNEQVIPASITANTVNQITVTFDTSFVGTVVVKR